MEVTPDEAKTYLRVSSSDEDELITHLIASATGIVQDIARFPDEEWESGEEKILIRMRIAILYTVAYLYEHREEANHSQLNLTLRALLFGVRKEDF